MGLTAARLYLLAPGGLDDPAALVTRAYAKLGWAPPQRGAAATRHVLLRATGDWIALEDSAVAALDDGSLPELAALLGRAAGSATVVATVQDSDAFVFLLHDKGRQVDAAGDGLTEPAVAMPRGKRQAAVWSKALAPATLYRALAGEPPLLPGADGLLARIAAAEALETAFAEERLAAWCDIAGIPATPGTPIGEIALAARPGKTAPGKPTATSAARVLRVLHATDDCPYHDVHPAPWPCTPDAETAYRWLITSAGGGIDGLTLQLDIDRAAGAAFRLREIHLRAHPFFNGQMTSMTPLAEWGHAVSAEEAGAARLVVPVPDFAVRAPAAGKLSQALLILRLGIAAPTSGEATIRPTLDVAGEPTPLALPALRLRATAPDWTPLIAAAAPPGPVEAEALLRLNAPSLHHAVAILPETDAARGTIRRLFEGFIRGCTGAGLLATLTTEKFMTARAHVGKARHAIPLVELLATTPWMRIFDPAARIQTARLDIAADDTPLAGLVLQASLRGGADPAAPDRDGVLNVALWLKPEGASMVGLDWAAAQARFRDWMQDAAPLQGWEADCAWIPAFDRAEAYEHTPYEVIGTTPAARMRIHDATMARAWRLERLKFVAPRLWLGAALVARVDPVALEAVAEARACGDGLALRLRPGQPLTALEAALRPILPEAR